MAKVASELTRVCSCGTSIWEAQSLSGLPKFAEAIICPRCGLDHSRAPSLRWRMSQFRYRFRKRRQLFGLRQTLKDWRLCWYLPRELKPPVEASC